MLPSCPNAIVGTACVHCGLPIDLNNLHLLQCIKYEIKLAVVSGKNLSSLGGKGAGMQTQGKVAADNLMQMHIS